MVPDTILAIDAGNSRIKWGVHDGRAWTATVAIETARAGDLSESLRGIKTVGLAIASNVAGAAVQAAIEAACKGLAVRFVRSEASQLGVTTDIAIHRSSARIDGLRSSRRTTRVRGTSW